ncbi:MAG: hypothetical protein CM15mP75_1550 [Flammeovirgaceae bacterium]|nr:MAG: hypothetical protein CM15mP75_1550 [Flammeovirgaceae bacterium]
MITPKNGLFRYIYRSDEYLLIWASGKDRGNSNVFRTLINWKDEFKYLIPDSQTSINGKI